MKNLFYLLLSISLFSCDIVVDTLVDSVDTSNVETTIETGPFVIDSFMWVDSNYKISYPKHLFLKNHKVIIPTSEKLIALDAQTGELVWEQKSGPNVTDYDHYPIEYKNDVYYSEDHKLWKLDQSNGDLIEIKDFTQFENSYIHGVTIVDDIIYFTTSNSLCDSNYFVNFYRIPLDGASRNDFTPYWSVTTENFNGLKSGFSNPTIVQNQQGDDLAVFHMLLSNPKDSWIDSLNTSQVDAILAYNITQKKEEWYNFNVAPYYSHLEMHGNKLFTYGSEGLTHLNFNTGETIWKTNIEEFWEGIDKTQLIFKENTIYAITGQSNAYSLDINSGQINWVADLDIYHNGKKGSAYLHNSKIVYISEWGMLNIIDQKNGKAETYHLPREVYASGTKDVISSFNSMVLDGNTVIASDKNSIMAFDISNK